MLESLLKSLNSRGSLIRLAGWTMFALLVVQVSASVAFQLFDSSPPDINHKARAWATPASSKVRLGESFYIYVRIALGTGWHIYSLERQGDGEDLATVIRIDEKFFRGQGKWKEPDPEIILDQALNKIVKTHQGTVEFQRNYLVGSDLKPGTYPVAGSILFRACDNRVCTLPNEVSFSTQVTVVDEIN